MQATIADTQLFNATAFSAALEKSDKPLQLFKQAVTAGQEHLDESFIAGTSIQTLIYQRAWFIDQILVPAWQQFVTEKKLTLVAVGGYGRGELHPASDIDLMVLTPPRCSKSVKDSIQQFLVFLWDIGLEVGQSVRTVRDCINESRQDITVATNLMESRLLTGNKSLYREMRERTGPDKLWPTKKFFAAKLEEQVQRHKKYDDSEHKLEPNIKEGPGGLRDIQMIGWVAKRHFGTDTLKGLVKHKFLTEEEYNALDAGQSLLWRVRFALHYITGRREDRLLFDYQRNVANLFGFYSNDNSCVEQFMKMYYRTVRELNILNEILLQHFQEAIIYASRREKIKPLNRRFQVRNDYLEVTHEKVFRHYPFALLEMFLLMQQNRGVKGVRASTIRLVRQYAENIDADFRQDIRNRSLFMEIIKQPRLVGHELRRMHRYGVLGRYLPEFGNIEGMMQFDLFHVYTVDEHILFVVRNMRLFGLPENRDKYPVYHHLLETLPKQELLYLAGLFHDIAKGRGGDHSELGARDAREFCKLHGLSDYDADFVAWLVLHHLLMSKTAQRKDISDPEVIKQFAEAVGDRNHLNYLYLLTVADIQGTDPALWNNWKESLLAELYQKTLQALRRGLENPINKEALIAETKNNAMKLVKNTRNLKLDLNLLWQSLGEDYFLRHTPEEIAWHSEAIAAHTETDEPLVMLEQHSQRGGTQIFVYMKNRDNIFAATTRTLDRLGLNIVDARIITSENDYTLDSYIVLENNGEPINNKSRADEIISALQKSLANLDVLPRKLPGSRSRRHRQFTIETRVHFTLDENNNRNIMEVITSDRPGVLSRIGLALNFCGVSLQGAKIATYGARVEDIFFITDRNNRMIDSPIKFECLENSIITSLEGN